MLFSRKQGKIRFSGAKTINQTKPTTTRKKTHCYYFLKLHRHMDSLIMGDRARSKVCLKYTGCCHTAK